MNTVKCVNVNPSTRLESKREMLHRMIDSGLDAEGRSPDGKVRDFWLYLIEHNEYMRVLDSAGRAKISRKRWTRRAGDKSGSGAGTERRD